MKKINLNNKGFTYLDEEDYVLLKDKKWYLSSNGYAANSSGVPMHKIIMLPPKGKVVDHINRNRLDNRRNNLRICTQSQNILNSGQFSHNTSGYKGVHWYKAYKKWQVYIGGRNNRINLGYYSDLKEAIRVRKKAEEYYETS